MRIAITLSLALASLIGSTVRADDPPKETVEPKAADADAKLPEGFPGGTKPGTIEIKRYPAYRSAVAKGEGMTSRSGDMMFWALFRHISQSNVEMTAPVINTYKTPGLIEKAGTRGDLTMEFLYEKPDQGKAGAGVGAVEVVDHPAVTVVALGIQGGMDDDQMREGLNKLRSWIDEHKAEWVEDGPPRRLGYHGPGTPVARRLWEVQLPIKPAGGTPAKP
jgi:hypothetical protein